MAGAVGGGVWGRVERKKPGVKQGAEKKAWLREGIQFVPESHTCRSTYLDLVGMMQCIYDFSYMYTPGKSYDFSYKYFPENPDLKQYFYCNTFSIITGIISTAFLRTNVEAFRTFGNATNISRNAKRTATI